MLEFDSHSDPGFATSDIPPHSVEAECAVLGSILRDNDCSNYVFQILNKDYFYFDSHQKIFSIIEERLIDAEPVDLVILAEELKSRNQLEDIGGYGYVAKLWDSCPTSANVEHYAKIVKDKFLLRKLIFQTQEILQSTKDGIDTPSNLISQASAGISDLSQLALDRETFVNTSTLLASGAMGVDRRQRLKKSNVVDGILTGFPQFDQVTGGFRNGEYVIIAARPSVGKTAFILNIMQNVCWKSSTCLFFSIEQKRSEIAERLFSIILGIDSSRMRKGELTKNEMNDIAELSCETAHHAERFLIDDTRDVNYQTMLAIAKQADAEQRRNGRKLDAIFVDYLQLIEPTDSRKNETRAEAIGMISRRLKSMARALDVPVICLAQLNRNSENRGDNKPRISDLRESGNIEQDADQIILLSRKSLDNQGISQESEIVAEIAKNRNGSTGEILFRFFKNLMRFEEAGFNI